MAASDHLNSHQFYHGTGAEVPEGGHLVPGKPGNYVRRMKHVYMTEDLEQAKHYAWNASGGGRGVPHVYQVEPTGEFRHRRDAKGPEWASEEPLRVVKEVWRHGS